MRERLLITVLVLFAYSCIDAGSTPQTDKEIQLASPGHELTIKTIVNGNRMLMANDGEENAAVAEERMASETAATGMKNFFSTIKKPFSKASEKAQTELTNYRQTRRQKRIRKMLAQHYPDHVFLDKGVSVRAMEGLQPPPSEKRIKKYATFLKKRIKTFDKLLTSSDDMQWWKVWKFARYWRIRRLIRRKPRDYEKLVDLRVRLKTLIKIRGGHDKYVDGYAKYLGGLKTGAQRLYSVPIKRRKFFFWRAKPKTKKSAKVQPTSGDEIAEVSEPKKRRAKFFRGTAGNQPTDVQPPKRDEATASTSTSILSKLKPRASAQNPPDNHPQVPPPSP